METDPMFHKAGLEKKMFFEIYYSKQSIPEILQYSEEGYYN